MHRSGIGRLVAAALVCLAALAAALSLSACGGEPSEARAKAGTEASVTTPGAKSEAAGNSKAAKATTAGSAPCAAQLHDLLAAMDGLRTDLVGGLAYEQYVVEVKKIAAIYSELPVEELTLGCLRAAGTAGERALNRYIAAGNEWSDCVEVPSCEAASIEAPLQDRWRQASEYLSKAQRGLRQRPAG